MATRPSLEDLLKDIPRQKLNQPCRDDHLSKIALSLTDWQSVAPFLGLTEADEEEIKRDYSNTKTQKIAMLRKWKKRYGRKAKYRKLATVFWDLEQTDLVENVCKLLQTKSSSSSSDDSEGDPSATKMNLPRYKKEQACVVVVDREGMSADAKVTQERTLDSYVGYGNLVVADREDLDTTAKATQEHTLDSYAEYLRGRYSTELPAILHSPVAPSTHS